MICEMDSLSELLQRQYPVCLFNQVNILTSFVVLLPYSGSE